MQNDTQQPVRNLDRVDALVKKFNDAANTVIEEKSWTTTDIADILVALSIYSSMILNHLPDSITDEFINDIRRMTQKSVRLIIHE